MTLKTVFCSIFGRRSSNLPAAGDLPIGTTAKGHLHPKTSQSEIADLFHDELRGHCPSEIMASDSAAEPSR
ncbi:hypothetical protein HW561_07905 [Rhodobacteraceae bacterium B1Z28]|uniref:Uncharacterized protein n=1 Tax=Ruegeria haliotis TaxID=2747601 RepID=A0ABX2PNJ2_9RHOB|nr:hypothetical protein [Ruegeria haliotis]NVO55710.1 hypothetical protein [Ruegeria haliotis]